MAEDASKADDSRDEELSLVDLLAVLIKKRRLVLAIALAGSALGLLFSLSDLLKPSVRHPRKVYTATVQAYVDDTPMMGSLVPLAKSDLCADAVAKKLGAEAGAEYKKSAAVSLDATTHFLSVAVTSKSERQALDAARAAVNALSGLTGGPGGGPNRHIAEVLEARAVDLKVKANQTADYYPATDGMRLAAYASVSRIEVEAFRDFLSPAPAPADDFPALALDSLAQNRAATERLALESFAKSLGGNSSTLSRKAEASLARETALLLQEAAELYRSLSSLPERSFNIVSSSVAPTVEGAFHFKAKAFILAIFASLFLGILAAFAANAWDRVREDPEAMAKLKDAMGGSPDKRGD